MSQIGTALSLAAGAFATGMTGMPNFALQIYNNAVEKDLEKQREDRNSLWNRFVQAGNSAEHADQYVRASMDKAVAARAAQQAALIKNVTAAQGLARFSADMNLKAEGEIQKIKKDSALEAQARAQAAVLEIKPNEAGLAAIRQADLDAEAKAAREREEVRKNEELKLKKSGEARGWKELSIKEIEANAKLKAEENKQDANVFNVSGSPVTAKDSKIASKAEAEILGQTDFVDLAQRTLETFKQNPKMVYVPMSDAKQLADLQLAQLLERYPKSERFTRPLNLTAATVIKNGLNDPTSFKSAIFGNPQLLLQQLIDNAKHDRKQAILNYSKPEKRYRAQAFAAIQALEDKESQNYGVDFTPAH
jgi:hypothetical protein